MKAQDVKIGARVTDAKTRYKRGTVLSNDEPGGEDMLSIEWDDNYRHDKIETVSLYDLRIVPVPLEADFAALKQQFQIAVNAIQAASRIASDRGTSLYEWDKEEILSSQDLFNALDNAGWQTSTMTRDC